MIPLRCRYLQKPFSLSVISWHTVLTVSPVDLILRNDDLTAIRIIGSWNRVLKETDGPDNFAFLDNANFTAILARTKVAWIADNLLSFHSFSATGDTNEFAFAIGDNFVDSFVQHICTPIDSAKTSE